jgi:hypothetical protein
VNHKIQLVAALKEKISVLKTAALIEIGLKDYSRLWCRKNKKSELYQIRKPLTAINEYLRNL